jgi:hypothetical protein
MVNNQLKIHKKRGLWQGEKTYLKKKNKSQPGFVRSLGSQINQVLPGFYSSQYFTLSGLVQLPILITIVKGTFS